MARLGPGTWYHPADGIPSDQVVARTMFLAAATRLAPSALVDLHEEVLPAFQVWTREGVPKVGRSCSPIDPWHGTPVATQPQSCGTGDSMHWPASSAMSAFCRLGGVSTPKR